LMSTRELLPSHEAIANGVDVVIGYAVA
jgi:hypothetical protein